MIPDYPIKEQLVQALMQHGFDVWTACELAHDKIKELNALPSGSELKFHAGKYTFTIKRK